MTKSKEIVQPNDHASVSVRQIDNGYIVAKSSYRDGEYKSSETFTKERPKVELEVYDKAPARRSRPTSANSLSSAIKHTR